MARRMAHRTMVPHSPRSSEPQAAGQAVPRHGEEHSGSSTGLFDRIIKKRGTEYDKLHDMQEARHAKYLDLVRGA